MKAVPKFQEGGFMSLFTQYTPIQSQTPSRSARSSYSDERPEKEDKGKLTEKDLFDLVSKVDGLPNDMKALVTNLSNMFKTQQLYGRSDISDLANVYLSNLYQIKMASYNKKEYDKAYTEVTKNGGLNEYAITSNGDVVVLDEEDNIGQISVTDLLNNVDKYKPLTNSNLLYFRAYYPEYKNNNQILNTVANGIGIEQVSKMIREQLTSLGTSESIRSGYSVKADSYIIQGLNVLSQAESAAIAGQTGMTLDGMYENKIITKDQKQQAEAALQYIYNSLPTNAKALLGLKSGNASNPQAGAQAMILQLITSRMNQTNSSETTYKGTIDEVTKSKNSSKGGSSDDIKTDPYYNIVRSWAGEDAHITINPGSNGQIDVDGTIYSTIPDSKGQPIGQTSLYNALKSGFGGIVTDPSAITFGNIQIKDIDQENIVFNGHTGGTLVPLPTKRSLNNTKVVDLDSLDSYNQAMKDLDIMGITSIFDKDHQQEIVRVLYNNHLEHLIDMSTGGVDYSQFGQFMIVDGYIVKPSSDDPFRNSNYVTKVSSDSDEIKLVEKVLSTNKDQDNYTIDPDDWGIFEGSYQNVYKGSIYIPITSDQLKALTASGQNIKESDAMKKEYEYQIWQKRLRAKEPGTV